MNKINFGLCCQFHHVPIKFRLTTLAYLSRLKAKKEDTLQFLSTIILDNLNALKATLNYCAIHQIGSFRINSQFLPAFKHVEHGYQLDHLPDSPQIFEGLTYCKKLAEEKKIRLCFHPDHFVVLSSPHPAVIQNSLQELEYHGEIAEWLGADVINIHIGGVYGNKENALKQFKQSFNQLSMRVKERLTIENDDKSYTPQDLLPFCNELKIPLVYDVHHHRCLPDELTIEQASDFAYQTWNREPLFHLSSPAEGWSGPKPYRHHDFIDVNDFPTCWLKYPYLTVEIEAKLKEVAILKLIQELKL